MLSPMKDVLERLRRTLGRRTEDAYRDRDAKGISDLDQSYAAGEAHAYGTASDDVRAAQKGRDET